MEELDWASWPKIYEDLTMIYGAGAGGYQGFKTDNTAVTVRVRKL